MRKKYSPIVKPSYLVKVSCGCNKVYDTPRPAIGADVFCRFHGRVTVLGQVNEWTLRCQHCIYSRAYGASEDECVRAAEKHAGVKIGHAVDVRLEGKFVRRIQAERGTNLILDFHKANPTHQTSLRSIVSRRTVT